MPVVVPFAAELEHRRLEQKAGVVVGDELAASERRDHRRRRRRRSRAAARERGPSRRCRCEGPSRARRALSEEGGRRRRSGARSRNRPPPPESRSARRAPGGACGESRSMVMPVGLWNVGMVKTSFGRERSRTVSRASRSMPRSVIGIGSDPRVVLREERQNDGVGRALDRDPIARVEKAPADEVEPLLRAVHDENVLGARPRLLARAKPLGDVRAKRWVAGGGSVLKERLSLPAKHFVEHLPEGLDGKELLVRNQGREVDGVGMTGGDGRLLHALRRSLYRARESKPQRRRGDSAARRRDERTLPDVRANVARLRRARRRRSRSCSG